MCNLIKKATTTKKANAKKPAAKKASAAKGKPRIRVKKAVGQKVTARKESAPTKLNPSSSEIPFELLVSERVATSPRLKLGWRVPQAIADGIREIGATEKSFVLLLVIDQETGKAVRLIQPILEQIAILDYNFDHPGKYTILGTIICNTGGCEQCDDFIKRWEGWSYSDPYAIKPSDEAGGGWDINFKDIRQGACHGKVVGRAAINLEISREFFSKEPPAWLREWVDEGYPLPSRNDCEFRRRALIWAFSTKLIWLVVWSFIYVIATAFWSTVFAGYMMVGLLFGCRGLKWRAVRHPWTTEFKGYGPSVFTTKADGKPRTWILRLFCPPIMLGIIAIGDITWKLIKLIPAEWIPTILYVGSYVLIGTAVAVLIGWIGLVIIRKTAPAVSKRLEDIGQSINECQKARIMDQRQKQLKRRQTQERKQEEAAQLAQAKRYMALGQLVTRPNLVKIELVPREYLSWYVRWLNFKTTVCRPFATHK